VRAGLMPMTHRSVLAQEVAAAPDVVARQVAALEEPLARLVARLDRRPPQVVVTCARGSSAHAATFAKHLLERYLAIPVAAAAPSIASVYHSHLRLRDQLVLVISQSGKSDDLIAFARSAQTSGAVTVALTNDAGAALATACEFVLPIGAGAELSVAATKTFVATLSALLRLTAAWARREDLAAAIARLPGRLAEAGRLDWYANAGPLAAAASLITIGRGPTLAIAREAALKLKETCNLHAEAFSGAEFMHGPVALVSARYPVLLFMPSDAAADGMREFAAVLRSKGSVLIAAEPGPLASDRLPALAADQPETDAVCLIQSFYPMLVGLAERLGIDIDKPRHLNKVTRTL
jgi:glutamine---fructose-6-phosphate transaminase (isomerizing)